MSPDYSAAATPPAVAKTNQIIADNESPSLSPKNRLKFLCSHSGKLYPRPSDGHIKYLGGDTRILAVDRSISFSELKKKIQVTFNTDSVIKYQLSGENSDVLVSVISDEDLAHMLDEYDNLEALHPNSPSSSPRFRLFLVPSITANTFNSLTSSVDIHSSLLSHRAPKRGLHRVQSTPNLGGGSGARLHHVHHNLHQGSGYGLHVMHGTVSAGSTCGCWCKASVSTREQTIWE